MLIFQPTVNSSGGDKQNVQCLDCICELGQNAQLLRVDIYYGLRMCLGGRGGTFWLHKESLIFKGAAA